MSEVLLAVGSLEMKLTIMTSGEMMEANPRGLGSV